MLTSSQGSLVSSHYSPTSIPNRLIGRWNVVFNLPIPGWLPGSSKFGPDSVGTCYALYATATFVNLDDPHATPFFSVLCSPFRNREWSAKACKPITVRRFVEPPSSEARAEAPQVTYSVKCKVLKQLKGPLPVIPSEIMESLRIIVALPVYISTEDHKIPLLIRLRAEDVGAEVGTRLRLAGFSVDIIQTDKCRSVIDVFIPRDILTSNAPAPTQRLNICLVFLFPANQCSHQFFLFADVILLVTLLVPGFAWYIPSRTVALSGNSLYFLNTNVAFSISKETIIYLRTPPHQGVPPGTPWRLLFPSTNWAGVILVLTVTAGPAFPSSVPQLPALSSASITRCDSL